VKLEIFWFKLTMFELQLLLLWMPELLDKPLFEKVFIFNSAGFAHSYWKNVLV